MRDHESKLKRGYCPVTSTILKRASFRIMRP